MNSKRLHPTILNLPNHPIKCCITLSFDYCIRNHPYNLENFAYRIFLLIGDHHVYLLHQFAKEECHELVKEVYLLTNLLFSSFYLQLSS